MRAFIDTLYAKIFPSGQENPQLHCPHYTKVTKRERKSVLYTRVIPFHINEKILESSSLIWEIFGTLVPYDEMPTFFVHLFFLSTRLRSCIFKICLNTKIHQPPQLQNVTIWLCENPVIFLD